MSATEADTTTSAQASRVEDPKPSTSEASTTSTTEASGDVTIKDQLCQFRCILRNDSDLVLRPQNLIIKYGKRVNWNPPDYNVWPGRDEIPASAGFAPFGKGGFWHFAVIGGGGLNYNGCEAEFFFYEGDEHRFKLYFNNPVYQGPRHVWLGDNVKCFPMVTKDERVSGTIMNVEIRIANAS